MLFIYIYYYSYIKTYVYTRIGYYIEKCVLFRLLFTTEKRQ